MRFRIQDNRQTVTDYLSREILQRLSGCNATAPTWNHYDVGPYTIKIGTISTMLDVVVPGFNKQTKVDHRVFFNPMVQSSFTIDAGYGSGGALIEPLTNTCSAPYAFKSQQRFGTYSISEGRIVSPGPGTIQDPVSGMVQPPATIIAAHDMSALVTEAVTECLASRGTSGSNQWETVAELHKSLALAKSAADSIELFTRRKTSLLSRSKAAGNAYLLYRYGFTPLMASLADATAGVLKAVGKVRQTSRGSASTSKTVTESASTVPYGAYQIPFLITTTEEVTVRATSLDEYEASLASNIGFSSKGLMMLPWELVPYSFVVDWFANVGDVYASLLPTFGLRGLGSCYTVERKIRRTVAQSGAATKIAGGYNVIGQPSNAGYTCSWRHKTRTPGLPSPGLVIRSDFGYDSQYRCWDSLSLVVQRLQDPVAKASSPTKVNQQVMKIPKGYF